MSITVRPWFSNQIQTLPLKRFVQISRGDNREILSELFNEKSQLKLYFDIDKDIYEELNESEIEKMREKTNKFIEFIFDKFGGVRECIYLDFSGRRTLPKDKFKYSIHLIFPHISISNHVLSNLSNKELCKLYFEYNLVDSAAYKKGGFLRQFGTRKPLKKGSKIHYVGNSGKYYEYKNGELNLIKKVTNKQFIDSLLTTKYDGKIIDITEKLDEWISDNSDKVAQKTNSIIVKSGDGQIPEKFMKIFNDIQDEKLKKQMITSTMILWNLPKKFGEHEDRMRIIPCFKFIEQKSYISRGELYMSWLGMIRTELSDKDYLEHYNSTPYDSNKIPNVLDYLFRLKQENKILVFAQEILIDKCQKTFTNKDIMPKYKNMTTFFSRILEVAGYGLELDKPSKSRTEFLIEVFSQFGIGFNGGEEIFVIKTEENDVVVYKKFPRRNRCPLNKNIFKFVDDKDNERLQPFMSFFIKLEYLFTKELKYNGPWAEDSNVINLSPKPHCRPIKDEKTYDEWLSKFKSYYLAVFLGNELEERREELFVYMMSWYREIIFGNEPTQKTIVLTDVVGGLGKSFLYSDLPTYMLDEFYTRKVQGSLIKLSSSSFSELNEGTKLITIEEADGYNKQSKRAFNLLKDYVTARTIEISRKYQDTRWVKNTLNIVVNSNEKFNPFLVSTDSRRMIFLTLKNIFSDLEERNKKVDEWATLMKKNQNNFAYFLKFECDDWSLHKNDSPRTQAIINQTETTNVIKLDPFLTDLVDGMEDYINSFTNNIYTNSKTINSYDGKLYFSISDLRDLLNYSKTGNWKSKQIRISANKSRFRTQKRRRFMNFEGKQVDTIPFVISLEDLESEINLPFEIQNI